MQPAELRKLARLYEAAARIYHRKPRQWPDDWARSNRVYPVGADVPGPRDPSLTPYVIPVERAVAAAKHRRVVAIFSAQSGKSELALDLIGERLDDRPCPIVYVGPTKQFLTEQFEPRIMQLLEQAPTLAAKLATGKRMTKTRKIIGGVPLRLAHAGSPTALKSDPIGLAILDEYVDMKKDVRKAGDPLALVEARGQTYADFVTYVVSTPSQGVAETCIDPGSGLELWTGDPNRMECPQWRIFLEGTRRHFCWPCRDCQQYFVPRFRLLRWPKGASPMDAWRDAYVQCPRCEADRPDETRGRHYEVDKRKLNAAGRYVAPGQRIADGIVTGPVPDSAADSYWVSGLCSPFQSFGDRARDFLNAVRSADQNTIRAVTNQHFGELWAPSSGDTPDLIEVHRLKQPYRMKEWPALARLITAGVDVQKNRLIAVAVAWGPRGEGWLIDFREFWGRTNEGELSGTDHPAVWGDLLDWLETPFDGHRVRLTLIDAGFNPTKALRDTGETSIVYDFCRANQRFCRPARGYATLRSGKVVNISRFEVTPSGKGARYGLDLVHINTDWCKSWVHGRIRWPADQPGAFHIPQDTSDDYCAQLIAESRLQLPSGKIQWVQTSRENHALDATSMAYAAGYILNVHRIPDARRVAPRRVGNDSPPPGGPALAKTVEPPAPQKTNAIRRTRRWQTRAAGLGRG